jgi:glutathione S-transferase
MAPTDDYTVVVTALDARPGGVWRLEMRHPAGAVHAVHGSYRTLEAPSKLSFTWSWEEDAAVRDTLVTVEFHPEGDGTRIVLVHELLPNAESRDKHEAGWIGCLARLPRGI